MKKKIFFVINNWSKIYMRIEADDEKQAAKIFEEKTNQEHECVYNEKNWIRGCGKTQAEFFDLKEYETS